MGIESTTIEGIWWINGDDKPPVQGVLEHERKIRLNFSLNSDATKNARNLSWGVGSDIASVIHGRDSHNKPVTLFGCRTVDQSWSRMMVSYEILAIAALHGIALESWRTAAIRTASFKINHLPAWTGWSLYQMGPWKDGEPITLTVDTFREVTCIVESGVEFRVERGTTFSPQAQALEVQASGHVHFRFVDSRSMAEVCDKWLPWATSLLSLLVGTPVDVEAVVVATIDSFDTESEDETPINTSGRFIGAFNKPSVVRISDPHQYNMIAPYPEIVATFPAMIGAWHNLYGRMEPAISVFSAIVLNHSLYDTAQFMFLVQVLEFYHTCSGRFSAAELPKAERDARITRALCAMPVDLRGWAEGRLKHNSKSLRAKLLDVFQANTVEAEKLFGDLKDAASRISYTRNNLTHHIEDVNPERLLSAAEIALIVFRLEAFIWALFLRELGIDGEPINRLLHRATSIEVTTLRE